MSTNGLLTKAYLDKKLGQFGKKLKDELKTELKRDLKSELLEIKDEIVGEIKDMREEFNTHQYSHIRVNDDLQEHDRRLKKLESPKI